MANTDTPLTLPVITIDPTFASVIQDVDSGIIPSDQFWISCYKTSQSSVHAKVHVELDQVDRNLVHLKPLDGDVEIVRTGDKRKEYTLSCGSLGIPPTNITLPTQEYRDFERSDAQKPHRITAFDLAPDGSKFATGFLDGSVFLYPTSPTTESDIPTTITLADERVTSRPHLSTITHLKFFPSSRVLLSAAADFSLSILPADLPAVEPGTRIAPARTLRGHTRSITSTAIIALGRNILSASLDSTVKLWDVPSSTAITSFVAHSPILSASLGDAGSVSTTGDTPSQDAREVPEMSSKVVFAGLQNGAVEQFDLRLKKSVYKSSTGPSGLSSIVYSSERNLLATGSSKGVVALYDTRALGTVVTSFQRNEAGIEDLEFADGRSSGSMVSLAIATADGLPYIANITTEGPVVGTELAGGDCDPVRNVRARKAVDGRTEIWSAGDDAVVRRYIV